MTNPSLLQSHPQGPAVSEILQRLTTAGHRALLAGGCVRDFLLGRVPEDLDVATSATPDQVMALFERTVAVGKAFGVVRVLLSGADVEVATFREDGRYQDGRRPESVHFSGEKEDALRRDFTVNALFWDPARAEVLDYVGGQSDLGRRILKAVGDPARRFSEDHLRLLRAVRFAAQLGFEIDSDTWGAICDKASLLATVSQERIRDEILKMIWRGRSPRGFELFESSGMARVVCPELSSRFSAAMPLWRLSLGSPPTSEPGAWMAWLGPLVFLDVSLLKVCEKQLGRLRLSKAVERDVITRLRLLADPEAWKKLSLGRRIGEWDQPAIREAWELWMRLKTGALSMSETHLQISFTAPQSIVEPPEVKEARERWQDWQKKGGLPPRLLTGTDLSSRWQGPRLGRALEAAYEAQLEGVFNDLAGALEWRDRWQPR